MTRRITTLLLTASVAIATPLFVGCASTATSASTGEYIDDSVITAKVKAALARDDDVNGFAVNVETYRGVVQLSGFVDTEEERQQAALAAQEVTGVVEVENNITIKPPPAAPQDQQNR